MFQRSSQPNSLESDKALGDQPEFHAQIEQSLRYIYNSYRQSVMYEQLLGKLRWDAEYSAPEGSMQSAVAQNKMIERNQRAALVNRNVAQAMSFLHETKDFLSDNDARNLDCVAREVEPQLRVSSDVFQLKQAALERFGKFWYEAKRQNNAEIMTEAFGIYLEVLKLEANAAQPGAAVYEIQLRRFEPEANLSEVRELIESAAAGLSELIPLVLERQTDYPSFPQMGKELIQQVVHGVAEDIGFNFRRGRIDAGQSSYACDMGQDDVRLMYSLHEHAIDTIYTAIHELGHGLYYQGLGNRTLPMFNVKSMALHETQARFWESMVGKSQAFCCYLYERLEQMAPSVAEQFTAGDLFNYLNHVEPASVRVGADDLTYNLHILLRMEIEEQLLDGSLESSQVAARWSELSAKYLGLAPQNDREGVLQDQHWFEGYLGYFPTYALGNIYAAQLWEAASREIPSVSSQIAEGRFDELRSWLQSNVYSQGLRYSPAELIKRVSGSELSSEFLKTHMITRYALGDMFGSY